MTRNLVDTRNLGAGLLIDLLDTGALRVGVVVKWSTLGLLGQVAELTPEQTRALWVELGLELVKYASDESLQQLLGAFDALRVDRPQLAAVDGPSPAIVDVHAKLRGRGEDEMHAPAAADDEPPQAAEWENPFA